jgi:hypothetical protein
MSDKPENPLAFASNAVCAEGQVFQEGMTLRDYFAGKALEGFCSNDAKHQRAVEYLRINPSVKKTISEVLTKEAYDYADAMLKAREV